MSKNQCAFWALDQCIAHGGGLLIVLSTHWGIPHVQWVSEAKRASQFVPFDDLPDPWHSVFGFEGEVRFVDSARNPLTRSAIRRGVFLLGLICLAWEVRNTWRDVRKIARKLLRTSL